MLDKIKLYLGISSNDYTEDELLEMIIEDCSSALGAYLGLTEIPSQFEFIVVELTIKRYRKIGSEGLTAEQIDVISNTFEEDPLSPYLVLLDTYKRTNRKLRML